MCASIREGMMIQSPHDERTGKGDNPVPLCPRGRGDDSVLFKRGVVNRVLVNQTKRRTSQMGLICSRKGSFVGVSVNLATSGECAEGGRRFCLCPFVILRWSALLMCVRLSWGWFGILLCSAQRCRYPLWLAFIPKGGGRWPRWCSEAINVQFSLQFMIWRLALADFWVVSCRSCACVGLDLVQILLFERALYF